MESECKKTTTLQCCMDVKVNFNGIVDHNAMNNNVINQLIISGPAEGYVVHTVNTIQCSPFIIYFGEWVAGVVSFAHKTLTHV